MVFSIAPIYILYVRTLSRRLHREKLVEIST